jgi:hypothetical protein
MASIFLDFERDVAASAADVRAEMRGALVELGFRITGEQVTLVEARRGSFAAGAAMGTSRMPVGLTVATSSGADACRVAVHLEDRVTGPAWGMNRQYQKIFTEIQARVDAGLARLDPAAAADFSVALFTAKSGTIPVLDATQQVSGRLQDAATSKVNELLQGGPKTRVPASWKKLDTVILCAPEAAARLELSELLAQLAVAVFITSRPGPMPSALVRRVEAFASRVEAALNQAGNGRQIEIGIEDADRPVVEFLHQQARLRERLPVRTLHACRTCRLEKVTNPDLERLKQRNQRLRAIGGSFGGTFSRSGISPFVLVGTLFRFTSLDPDYVCPRCQGTGAEAFVVTYCPRCGDLRSEAALRACAKCKLDLRSTLTPEAALWTAYPTPLEVPEHALPVAAPGPATSVPAPAAAAPALEPAAKRCSICGYEFSGLWRVVVEVSGGYQELFVCGRQPHCAPQSVVVPTLV